MTYFMKFFTKNEIIGVLVILLLILVLTGFNLRISLRRSRDAQRRADVNDIVNALDKYQKDFGFFPPSSDDGKIIACKGANFGTIPSDIKDENRRGYFINMLRGCDWGDDSLRDVGDDTYQAYLNRIPRDPKADEGLAYFYISDMNTFQLYAYLEGGKTEEGFRRGIIERNLQCGNRVCNFGKAYGETPLEISLQEYENEVSKGNAQK